MEPARHVVVVHGISDQVPGETVDVLARSIADRGVEISASEVMIDETAYHMCEAGGVRYYDAHWSDLSPEPRGRFGTLWVLARQFVRLPALALAELDALAAVDTGERGALDTFARRCFLAWVVGACVLVPALLVAFIPALLVQAVGAPALPALAGVVVLGVLWRSRYGAPTCAVAAMAVGLSVYGILTATSGDAAVYLAGGLMTALSVGLASGLALQFAPWLWWRAEAPPVWLKPGVVACGVVLVLGLASGVGLLDAGSDHAESRAVFADPRFDVVPMDALTETGATAGRKAETEDVAWHPDHVGSLLAKAGAMDGLAADGTRHDAPLDVVLYRLSHLQWKVLETGMDLCWIFVPIPLLVGILVFGGLRPGGLGAVVGVVVGGMVWLLALHAASRTGLVVVLLGAATVGGVSFAGAMASKRRHAIAFAVIPCMAGWCLAYLALVFASATLAPEAEGFASRYEVARVAGQDVEHYRVLAIPVDDGEAAPEGMHGVLLYGKCAKPRAPGACRPKGQDPHTWSDTPLGGTDLASTLLFGFAVLGFLALPVAAAVPGALDDSGWGTPEGALHVHQAWLELERSMSPTVGATLASSGASVAAFLHVADKAKWWSLLSLPNVGDWVAYDTPLPIWLGLLSSTAVGAALTGTTSVGTVADLVQDSVRWLDPSQSKHLDRVVGRVRSVILRALEDANGGPVVVVAHSQGTMLAVLALFGGTPSEAGDKTTEAREGVSRRDRVRLITCGSPLHWVYERLAPNLADGLVTSMGRTSDLQGWTNRYFPMDYVGRELWPGRKALGVDDFPIEVAAGHTKYFGSEEFGKVVSDVLELAAVTRTEPVEQGGQASRVTSPRL